MGAENARHFGQALQQNKVKSHVFCHLYWTKPRYPIADTCTTQS